eukprot:m.67328 g.67328  ORF g.67328 m.67328 type:complete len:214 (+) comp16622_c0_seq1:238-879(+)
MPMMKQTLCTAAAVLAVLMMLCGSAANALVFPLESEQAAATQPCANIELSASGPFEAAAAGQYYLITLGQAPNLRYSYARQAEDFFVKPQADGTFSVMNAAGDVRVYLAQAVRCVATIPPPTTTTTAAPPTTTSTAPPISSSVPTCDWSVVKLQVSSVSGIFYRRAATSYLSQDRTHLLQKLADGNWRLLKRTMVGYSLVANLPADAVTCVTV